LTDPGFRGKKDKGCEKGHKLKENEFPPTIGDGEVIMDNFTFNAKYTLPSGDDVHIRCYKIKFTLGGNDVFMYLGYEHPKDTSYAAGTGTVTCRGEMCFDLEKTIDGQMVKYRVLLHKDLRHSCPAP
jgi:hypothetical protein